MRTLRCLLLAVAACSGPSSADDVVPDDAAPDGAHTGVPVALSVSPADEARDVERDAAIAVTFSTDMAAGTLNGTFVVTRGGAPVTGAVAYDASTRTATFHPDVQLALLGGYHATITTGATDVDGVALAAERAWSFSVRDGRWSTAGLLFDASVASGGAYPRVAVDSAGRASVTWGQDANMVARFEPATGWGAAAVLDPTSNSGVSIASDPDGNMIAVWTQNRDPVNLVTSRFVPGTGWGPITLLEDDDAYAHHVGSARVATDRSGAAVVIWDQYDGAAMTYAGKNIRARWYVPGTGWAPAALLGEGTNPWIVIDASGHATAAWMRSNSPDYGYDVVTSRFDAATGWSAPRLLETLPGVAYVVRLVADDAGDVTAIWQQWNGVGNDLWTARFTAGGWSAASLLESSDGSVLYAELAGDPAGNVTVVWAEYGDQIEGWTRRYVAGSGWGPAVRIEPGSTSPVIGMDPAGNAIAIWIRGDTSQDLWASKFTPGAGWGPATRIDTSEVGDTFFPQIAVDALGGAVVVWVRSIGPSHSGEMLHMWRATFE